MKFCGMALFALGIYLRYLDSANANAAIACVVLGALLITQENRQ